MSMVTASHATCHPPHPMPFLSSLLLALSAFATTTKVSIGIEANMVSTDTRTAAHRRRAGIESRNATAIKKSSPEMSGLTTETFSKSEGATAPDFPSEDPTEIELEKWLEAWTNFLRSKHLLTFAESASPAKPAEFADRPPIPGPTSTFHSRSISSTVQRSRSRSAVEPSGTRLDYSRPRSSARAAACRLVSRKFI